MNTAQTRSPIQARATTSREGLVPRTIAARTARHWLGEAGHCSLCNRDERGRRGARIGVILRARDQETGRILPGQHWICPECVRTIAKLAP